MLKIIDLQSSTSGVFEVFTSSRRGERHQSGEKMSPKRARLHEKMNGASVSADTEIIKRVSLPTSADTEIIRRVSIPTSEDLQLRDELLEGIPNDITLVFIAPNFPWRAWRIASTLSADWQRAFQGGMVYAARVFWQMTQTFFVVLGKFCTEVSTRFGEYPVYYIPLSKRTLSLFSPSEERWFALPPFPGCHSGFPYTDKYVFLNGAIYNLGGARNGIGCLPSKEVHVLDLTRPPLEWRQCASMQAQRHSFRNIGVMQGKIFVFAGLGEHGRNEVYDPKVDAWSWIGPIRPDTHVSTVFSVGQEFFVCSVHVSTSQARCAAQRESVRDEKSCQADNKLMADLYGKTKLVVTDGPKGRQLISTSDDDAEDDMEGFHKIMENSLSDFDTSRPVFKSNRHYFSLTARRFSYEINSVEPEGSLRTRLFGPRIWTYTPVKNEWRVFEQESLGTHNVDHVQADESIELADATALVWKMSL